MGFVGNRYIQFTPKGVTHAFCSNYARKLFDKLHIASPFVYLLAYRLSGFKNTTLKVEVGIIIPQIVIGTAFCLELFVTQGSLFISVLVLLSPSRRASATKQQIRMATILFAIHAAYYQDILGRPHYMALCQYFGARTIIHARSSTVPAFISAIYPSLIIHHIPKTCL